MLIWRVMFSWYSCLQGWVQWLCLKGLLIDLKCMHWPSYLLLYVCIGGNSNSGLRTLSFTPHTAWLSCTYSVYMQVLGSSDLKFIPSTGTYPKCMHVVCYMTHLEQTKDGHNMKSLAIFVFLIVNLFDVNSSAYNSLWALHAKWDKGAFI